MDLRNAGTRQHSNAFQRRAGRIGCSSDGGSRLGSGKRSLFCVILLPQRLETLSVDSPINRLRKDGSRGKCHDTTGHVTAAAEPSALHSAAGRRGCSFEDADGVVSVGQPRLSRPVSLCPGVVQVCGDSVKRKSMPFDRKPHKNCERETEDGLAMQRSLAAQSSVFSVPLCWSCQRCN